jgi:hypothetical protein
MTLLVPRIVLRNAPALGIVTGSLLGFGVAAFVAGFDLFLG